MLVWLDHRKSEGGTILVKVVRKRLSSMGLELGLTQ